MAAQDKKKEKKLGWKKSTVLYLHDLLYLLVAIMVLFLLLFRVIIVSGDSMKMTLLDGDHLLLLSNNFYRNPSVLQCFLRNAGQKRRLAATTSTHQDSG